MEFSAEMIAGFLGGEVAGDPHATVNTIVRIEEGAEGGLAFLSNPKYEPYLYTTKASVVIVNRSLEPREAVRATMVRVDDAYGSFAKLLELYEANKSKPSGVSPQAAIHASATLGEGCYVGEFAVVAEGARVGAGCNIYPQVYIGMNVTLGDNVTLHSGVKVYEGCVVGNNVTIHAGSVIGADGFGWAPQEDGTYHRIPQIGNVVIEDNVDIGANTCVDRATMGSTVVGRGVKLDNLIQLGHNVSVGENTVIAAQTGIAGSSKVGTGCILAGQVGIAGHLDIGDGVKLGSKSGVSNNIAAGETFMGYPAMPIGKFQRTNAVIRNLLTLSADVNELKKKLK
jgi:UDP-3-O-[3-hydroxymyristoyl] glucosamine N-acyltransferase